MEKTIIRSERLGIEVCRIKHDSGLTMLLCPMEGFSTAYAAFTTKLGSVDTRFKTQDDADFVDVPEGVAHFLEHKMFENEEGDAFARSPRSTARAICLPAPTGFRNRSKSCWILSAGPILPKRRCRRSRELSDRKSGCTMTAGTGG